MKRAAGRPQDDRDLEELRVAQRQLRARPPVATAASASVHSVTLPRKLAANALQRPL
jgi:hypothetical protein